MGYVQNQFPRRPSGRLDGLSWESLGQLVQCQTLEAMALHFLDTGLAELCLDALTEADSEMTPLDLPLRGGQGNRKAARNE